MSDFLKRLKTALLVAAVSSVDTMEIIVEASRSLELPEAALDPAETAGLIRTEGRIVRFRHPWCARRFTTQATVT